jgi:ElaB/YqjD/DUF883 family membrane-anchored ribosome-binding protein
MILLAKIQQECPMNEEQPRPSNDYDLVKDKCTDLRNELVEFIQQNPLAAVALAAGVGYLLARLLSPRKQ